MPGYVAFVEWGTGLHGPGSGRPTVQVLSLDPTKEKAMLERLKRPGIPGAPPQIYAAELGERVGEVLDVLGVKPGEEFTVTDGKLAESARARRTDPDTSRQAAKSIDDLRGSQKAVLRFFEMHDQGFTDEELVRGYAAARGRALSNGAANEWPRQSESGLRSRRAELVDAGFLMDSRERRALRSGRKAIVWKLVRQWDPKLFD